MGAGVPASPQKSDESPGAIAFSDLGRGMASQRVPDVAKA
jgi:hypothetical protein